MIKDNKIQFRVLLCLLFTYSLPIFAQNAKWEPIGNYGMVMAQNDYSCSLGGELRDKQAICDYDSYFFSKRMSELDDSTNLYLYFYFLKDMDKTEASVELFDSTKSVQCAKDLKLYFIGKYNKNLDSLPLKIKIGGCSFEKKILIQKDSRYLYIVLSRGEKAKGHSCFFIFTDYAYFFWD